MKEVHLVYSKRPFAVSAAADYGLEHCGNLVDEELCLRLKFPVKNLQYSHLSLSSDEGKKRTRAVGTIGVTSQVIMNGCCRISIAFRARIVRDLQHLVGAEALGDETFLKKLGSLKSDFQKKESDRDTHTSIISPNASSTNPPDIKDKLPVHNIKGKLPVHNTKECLPNMDSDRSSECSSCADYTSFSSDEAEDYMCGPEAYIRRVRGRNKKFLQLASSKVTEEAVDAERIRRAKFLKTPDEDLDQFFPGGAKFAHQLTDRWARRDELEKARNLNKEDNKFERLFGEGELGQLEKKRYERDVREGNLTRRASPALRHELNQIEKKKPKLNQLEEKHQAEDHKKEKDEFKRLKKKLMRSKKFRKAMKNNLDCG